MRPNLYAVHKSIPPVHVLSQTNSCNINTGNHRLQLSVERESKTVIAKTRYKGDGSWITSELLQYCRTIAAQEDGLANGRFANIGPDTEHHNTVCDNFATTNETQAIASVLRESFVKYESRYEA